MEARSRLLFYLLLALVGASGAVLLVEHRIDQRKQSATESFQKLVGGLGFGSVLDLSGCAFGFDPRLDGCCSASVGPLPGGACFCGRHGGLLSYPPNTKGMRGGDDAIPPRN